MRSFSRIGRRAEALAFCALVVIACTLLAAPADVGPSAAHAAQLSPPVSPLPGAVAAAGSLPFHLPGWDAATAGTIGLWRAALVLSVAALLVALVVWRQS